MFLYYNCFQMGTDIIPTLRHHSTHFSFKKIETSSEPPTNKKGVG